MSDIKSENEILNDILGIQENSRELLGAIFIQSQRNYDMLAIIADKLGADAKGLSVLHENGEILAPAPSFIFENDDIDNLQDSLFEENA
jgi:hypothetical protein